MSDSPTPDFLARAFALFDEALERSAEDRGAWLASQDLDEDLREEVRTLLRAHAEDGVLDQEVPGWTLPAPAGDPATSAAHDTVLPRVSDALHQAYDGFEPLGFGGMARVYRAREIKHDRLVVLKVLRPEVAAQYGEERFLQEVRLISGLAHPHILPFLDSGRADGLLYFVMPWVDGESLADRLRTQGPMTPVQAQPYLRDIADALTYAHDRDLVHRDLKPANVLCSGAYAYLMDFGIAKILGAAAAGAGLTLPGVSPGTPRYMAPEQIDPTQEAGPPADVFAWGQLAHEVLTGTLATPGPGGATATRERLIRQVPGLPAAQVDSIQAALNESAEHRPTARELLSVWQAAPGPIAGRRGWRRAAAAVVGLLLAGAGWAAWSVGGPGASADAGPLTGPVAVAEFVNETGDPSLDFLGRMAGDWLTQGIRNLGHLPVVPWTVSLEVVQRARGDSAVDPVPVLESEAGARTVVTGRYYRVGDGLSFSADVSDARGERLLVAIDPVAASPERPEAAIEELRERIMGSLSALSGERTSDLPFARQRAPRLDAYRAFDRGLSLHTAQDYVEAKESFLEAHRQDTTFLPALLRAVAAAGNHGDVATRDSVLAYLEERRPRLSRFDDLRWQALDAAARGDAQATMRALRQASEMAPGARVAYNLALTANLLNRPTEALAALDLLDPDAGPVRGWAQYWTQRIHALHLLSRHEEESEAANEMVRRHPERTVAPVLLARALAAAGRGPELEAALAASALRPPRTYWSHGGALVSAGEAHIAHGAPDAGRALLERALAWLDEQTAADPDYLAHQYWRGTALYDLGRFREARTVFSELARANPRNGTYRGYLATLMARDGEADEAEVLMAPEDWAGSPGSRLLHTARMHAASRNLDRALAAMSEGLEQGISGWAWVHGWAHADLALMRADPRLAQLLQPDGVLP